MEVDIEEKKEVKNEEVAEDDDKLVKHVGHGRSSINDFWTYMNYS